MRMQLPSEFRPAAILERKLKSLNANTTSNAESKMSEKEIPDMMNRYGDRVVTQFLYDNPDINQMLRDPVGVGSAGSPVVKDGAMTKVTGKVATLPVEFQERFYEVVERQYNELIDELNQMGRNDLEVQNMDLDAEVLREMTFVEGTDQDNPFLADAKLQVVSAKRQNKPMTLDEIDAAEQETLGDDYPDSRKWMTRALRRQQQLAEEYIEHREAAEAAAVARGARKQPQPVRQTVLRQLQHVAARLSEIEIGQMYSMTLVQGFEPVNVIPIDVKFPRDARGNPVAPGSIRVRFAVASSQRVLDLSLAGSWTLAPSEELRSEWDDLAPKETRVERQIITGNLVRAFSMLRSTRGQVVAYTTSDGQVLHGILIPENVDLWGRTTAVTVTSSHRAQEIVDAGIPIRTSDGSVEILPIRGTSDVVEVRVAASRRVGEDIYTDDYLVGRAKNGEFRKRGDTFRARFDRDEIFGVVRHIQGVHRKTWTASIVDLRKKEDQFGDLLPQEQDDTDRSLHAVRESPGGDRAFSVGQGPVPARRPQAPVPMQPSDRAPVTADTPKRQTIIARLSDVLGLPIRTGMRSLPKRAGGVYYYRTKVARLRRFNDVEVAVHEAAHHIEKTLGMPVRHTEEVRALAYEGADSLSREGFAEFLRLYVTHVEEAKARAPVFYEHFEMVLTQFPDMQDVLVQARQQWEEYRALPSVQKAGTMIVSRSDTKRRRLPTFNQAYTACVDDLRPLQVITKMIEGKIGRALTEKESPIILAWLTRGWARKAEQFLKWGTFQITPEGVEFTGESLRDILQDVEARGERHLLDRYLAGKRIINDPRQAEKFRAIGELETWKQTVRDLEPRFKDVAARLYRYSDQLLDYLVASGRMAQETANACRKRNLFYAPLYRLVDGDDSMTGLSRTRYANLFSPVKKVTGSTRLIYSPTESLIYNTYTFINVAERARVGQALVDISKMDGLGEIIVKRPKPVVPVEMTNEEALREIAKQQGLTLKELLEEMGDLADDIDLEAIVRTFRAVLRPGPGEVILYDRGKGGLYEVAPELREALLSLDRDNLNTFVRILSYPTKWLRAGATTFSPEFALRNPFRDQFSAFIYSKYGYKPFWDMGKGIMAILSARYGAVRRLPGGEKWARLYEQFNASGAAHAALVSLDRDYLKENMRDLLRAKGGGIRTMVTSPLRALQMLSELTEEATRVAEFGNVLKRDGTDLDTILRAGREARDLTLDFSRIGSQTRSINAVIAFWNAQIQGIDKMARAFKERPVQTLTYAMMANTLPSLALYLAQEDDEFFQEIPTWRRILCMNIVTHNEDGSLRNIWSIPRPFEIGLLFGAFPEMFLQWTRKKDPELMREAVRAFGEGMFPGVFPTASVPVIEWVANKNMFLDRPIVPRGREDLPAELQYAPFTSEAMKLVGKGLAHVPVLGAYASPAKIENVVRGYTAGLGRTALDGIDAVLKASGIVDAPADPSMTLADIPGIRGFVQRFPSSNTRSIEMFYQKYARKVREFEGLKERAGVRGLSSLGIQVRARNAELEQMRAVAGALTRVRKLTHVVYRNRKMTRDEKREALDSLYRTMIDTARLGLGKEPLPKGEKR
jgi:hypothetical protein